MKIHVLSDLHVEFAPFEPPHTDADVVVLAGDIGVGLGAIEFAKTQCHQKPVVFVAGNHEYYRGAIPKLTDAMRQACEGTSVHLLEDEFTVIDGVRFLGATLWTDWALYGEANVDQAMEIASRYLADHHLIRKSPGNEKLSPRDTLALHRRSRAWLTEELSQSHVGPTVVVTHHGPSAQSCAERFRGDDLTAAFLSNLEPILPGADLWIHGHTHHSVDYRIGDTRIVSNQRGYPGEAETGFVPDFVVDLGS